MQASLHKGLRSLHAGPCCCCQLQLHLDMLCLQEVKAGGEGGAPGQWTANKAMRMSKKVGTHAVSLVFFCLPAPSSQGECALKASMHHGHVADVVAQETPLTEASMHSHVVSCVQYEEKGGDYVKEGGSKNEPKKGKPEPADKDAKAAKKGAKVGLS